MLRRANLLKTLVAAFPFLHCNAVKVNENAIEKLISPQARHLSENNTETCEMCTMLNATLLGDVYPDYPPDLVDYLEEGMNCEMIADLIRDAFSGGLEDRDCYDLGVLSFTPQCCSFTTQSSVCEQEVQSLTIGDDSGYSPSVEPVPLGQISLDVQMIFHYFALTSIDTKEGTAELFLGIDLEWEDDRLTWDPKDHGGCYYTNYRASIDPELTDIWVPPLDLLNRVDSIQNLPEAFAASLSDGRVVWNRFGGVKALCFFEGLERFPYDELSCTFEFGSTLRYSRMNFVLANENISFPLENEETQRKYQEFKVVPEKSTLELVNGAAKCRFYFKRSNRYYNNTIVIPTILFTILSFGVFLLDQRVGERLGFGVSILLVIVAQAILTADTLPVTEERLWINVLTQGSQYFAIAAVLESLLVAYLHYIKIEPMNLDDDAKNKDKSTTEDFAENEGEETSFLNETNSPSVLSSVDDNPGTNASEQNGKDANAGDGKKLSMLSSVKNFHWNAKNIAMLDKVCVIFFPLSYFIFIIVLFATNENFGS